MSPPSSSWRRYSPPELVGAPRDLREGADRRVIQRPSGVDRRPFGQLAGPCRRARRHVMGDRRRRGGTESPQLDTGPEQDTLELVRRRHPAPTAILREGIGDGLVAIEPDGVDDLGRRLGPSQHGGEVGVTDHAHAHEEVDPRTAAMQPRRQVATARAAGRRHVADHRQPPRRLTLQVDGLEGELFDPLVRVGGASAPRGLLAGAVGVFRSAHHLRLQQELDLA